MQDHPLRRLQELAAGLSNPVCPVLRLPLPFPDTPTFVIPAS